MEAFENHRIRLDNAVIWIAGLLLIYWLVFALVTPVTVWDSHVYNLARLSIAKQGGLFGNDLFLSERQILFPWSFDSVHLLFLSLGWGYALPSYLCLIGTAWIIFQMLRRTVGSRTAWIGVIALFALPTVIFQATSTKNDLGVVFVAAFSVYSLFRFYESSDPRWLIFSAVAIGFLPGTKSSGLLFAFLLCIASIWLLRTRPRLLAGWAISVLVSFCLLGSLEIYVNNFLIYGNPLGEMTFISQHSNPDGFAGAIANTIRYVFGFINVGWPLYPVDSAWSNAVEIACKNVLETLHLTNKGTHFSDQTLRFLRIGWEAASDYGPLGMSAMVISASRLVMLLKRDPAFWVSVAGWVLLIVTAFSIAWMPWNMRFLMSPAILFVVASLMSVSKYIERRLWACVVLCVFILYSAIAYPLTSLNKRPVDIYNAIINREALTLRERYSMQEVYDLVRKVRNDSPGTPWLLHAGGDSWVLGLLEMPEINLKPAATLDAQTLGAADVDSDSGEVFVLVLNRAVPPRAELPLVEVARMSGEPDSAIYLWLRQENQK